MIHEQIALQLVYLKSLVDGEKESEETCKKLNIPYTPSRRKYEDLQDYKEYEKEVRLNGDKNLLVMIHLHGEDGINMYGVYPFARRYVHQEYLVNWGAHGRQLLIKESEVLKEDKIYT